MENDLIRSFIALDLPKEAIKEIKKIQKKIEDQKLFIGKFTEEENIHLTLKFLGEIKKETLDKIKEKLKEIKFNKFEAKLGEIGVFSSDFIKIIWIKLEGEGVFNLQKKIDETLKNFFSPENRFMSHITIARVKNVLDKKKLIDFLNSIKIQPLSFEVSRFYLKKSQLKEKGPIYFNIETYELLD